MKNDYTLRAVLENPPRFEFVTPDGTQYLIDEECVRDLRAMMTRAVHAPETRLLGLPSLHGTDGIVIEVENASTEQVPPFSGVFFASVAQPAVRR